jgi:hypothetical protein
MKSTNNLLFLASLLAFGGAIIQAAIGFVPEWSAALGAGDELLSNPPLLLTLGLLMALVFAVCGLYGLSGAGLIRRLPLLHLGLFEIGLVCTLRGYHVYIPAAGCAGCSAGFPADPPQLSAVVSGIPYRGTGLSDRLSRRLEAAGWPGEPGGCVRGKPSGYG